MALKNISVIVTGKVQGVWFRYFTQKEGEKSELKGYVMNLDDGSVMIKASGEELIINDFLNWCQQGSPLSKVEKVTVEIVDTEYTSAFHIK